MKKNLLQRVTKRIDWLIVGLLLAILLASLVPARGDVATGIGWLSKVFLFLLFFVYGAKLAPAETLTGLKNWKLHLTITTFTFMVFPLFGLALRYATEPLVGQGLALGLLYLTLVPSTVQSSIAFTSVAHGNVAGAIVSASFSNVAGVVLTPLLVALTMATTGDVHISGGMILNIVVQILLPFVLGQLLHRYIGGWIVRHPLINKAIDRGTSWIIVYSSFSEAVVGGVWQQVTGIHLLEVVLLSVALVSLVLLLTWMVSGWLKFDRRDRIAIQFCGSKKSLSTGVAMGSVLFAEVASLNIGMLLLPLMIFHLFQLLVCAVLASRYGRKWEAAHEPA